METTIQTNPETLFPEIKLDPEYQHIVAERFAKLPKDLAPPKRENTVVLIPMIDGKCEWLLAQGLMDSMHLHGGVITLPCCSDVSYARNRLLNQFLRSPFEWCVMIDADTGFTRADLGFLLEGNDYAVNGVYSKKDVRGEVVTQGLGFARVHRSVLEGLAQIPDLCLPFHRHGESLLGFCFAGPTGIGGIYLGEDQAFWFMCHQIGVVPRLETRVRLRHVGRAEYVIGNFADRDVIPSHAQVMPDR